MEATAQNCRFWRPAWSRVNSFAATKYRPGRWPDVTVVCDGALLHLQHRGVLIATHARRHGIDKQAAGQRRGIKVPPRRPRRINAA